MGKSYKRGRFGSSNIGIRLSSKPVSVFWTSSRLKLRERAETEIVAGVRDVERGSCYLINRKAAMNQFCLC